jgi:hypothetical protein
VSIKRASLATDFERSREVLLGYLPTIVRDAPAGESCVLPVAHCSTGAA